MSKLIRLDTLQTKPLTWLWYPRIPAGRLTLLVGHPDRGKSIMACTLAGHVTSGRAWPDGQLCVQGTVLFFESEDDLEETVIPRLLAAESSLAHVYTIKQRHLADIADYLTQLHPKLLVISPLNTYLPSINTWNDKQVRAALQPLADLAAQSGVAIVGIMHPPKSKQAIPVHAVVGSVAFGAVARSVLTVEKGEGGLYLLEGIKNNLSVAIPPMGYRLLPWPSNPEIAKLQWEVVVASLSFNHSETERSSVEEACEYVRMALADGPLRSNVLREVAEKNGVTWASIKRARKILQVNALKKGQGKDAHWELSLPHP